MKAKWLILAVLVLSLVVPASAGFAAAPDIQLTQSTFLQASLATGTNGELGQYLVAPWDLAAPGNNVTSAYHIVQLVNPSPKDLWAFVTYWSSSEVPLSCNSFLVSSNGFGADTQGNSISGEYTGVMKVLVTNTNGQPENGLVGYKRQIYRDGLNNLIAYSEVRLQPVPARILYADRPLIDTVPDELKKIICLCQPTSTLGQSLGCPQP